MSAWRIADRPTSKAQSKIDPFALDDDRPPPDLVEDRNDVFAEHAEEEELHAAEEEQADDDRSFGSLEIEIASGGHPRRLQA
ncbi:hypothetical protein ACVWW6_004262 [Bradyrhizobium sp. USDA 3311]|uniref:hypothetical protein n=1 Tax=Bradyrhizobium sp. CCBAU 45394 TaxID=1325087 RepID=UPI002303EC9A|nr:hypothetical protein [Bradyrhizobium sp. CCBAU 45394]